MLFLLHNFILFLVFVFPLIISSQVCKTMPSSPVGPPVTIQALQLAGNCLSNHLGGWAERGNSLGQRAGEGVLYCIIKEADPSGDADRLWRERSQVPQHILVPRVAPHLSR